MRLAHLRGVADEHPACREEGAHLALEHGGVAEGVAVHAERAVGRSIVDQAASGGHRRVRKSWASDL